MDLDQTKTLTNHVLQFLADVNRFACAILGGPHVGLEVKEQFLLAHRWRMLRFSQGIEVTAAANLIDPCGSLLRVMIELGYVLSAVAADPANLTVLFEQGQMEGKKALEGLRKELAPSERGAALTDAYLDAEIAGLNASGSGFVPYNWAGLAKFKPAHATIYRLVSRHSHAGTNGTMDYFEGLDTETPKLRPNLPAFLVSEYCLTAAVLMLDALTALSLQTMTDIRVAEAAEMSLRWRALMTVE